MNVDKQVVVIVDVLIVVVDEVALVVIGGECVEPVVVVVVDG